MKNGTKLTNLTKADFVESFVYTNKAVVLRKITLDPSQGPFRLIPACYRPKEYGKFSISVISKQEFTFGKTKGEVKSGETALSLAGVPQTPGRGVNPAHPSSKPSPTSPTNTHRKPVVSPTHAGSETKRRERSPATRASKTVVSPKSNVFSKKKKSPVKHAHPTLSKVTRKKKSSPGKKAGVSYMHLAKSHTAMSGIADMYADLE